MNAHVEAFYEYMDAMDWFDTCNGLKRAERDFEYLN